MLEGKRKCGWALKRASEAYSWPQRHQELGGTEPLCGLEHSDLQEKTTHPTCDPRGCSGLYRVLWSQHLTGAFPWGSSAIGPLLYTS